MRTASDLAAGNITRVDNIDGFRSQYKFVFKLRLSLLHKSEYKSEDVREWTKEQMGTLTSRWDRVLCHRFEQLGIHYGFEAAEDAMLFKLRWSDYLVELPPQQQP